MGWGGSGQRSQQVRRPWGQQDENTVGEGRMARDDNAKGGRGWCSGTTVGEATLLCP